MIWEDKSWREDGVLWIKAAPSLGSVQTWVRKALRKRVDGFGERSEVWMGCCGGTGAVARVEASAAFPALGSSEYSKKAGEGGLPSEKWLAGLKHSSLQKQQKMGKRSFMPIQIALVPRDLAVCFTMMKYSGFNHHCLVQKL